MADSNTNTNDRGQYLGLRNAEKSEDFIGRRNREYAFQQATRAANDLNMMIGEMKKKGYNVKVSADADSVRIEDGGDK